MTDEKPIPDDEWKTIVRNVPLVSVDLIVAHPVEAGAAILNSSRS